MNKKYIVILNGGGGRPMFLVDNDDEAVLFDTEKEAKEAGKDNGCGEARGFEVIVWDYFEGLKVTDN